MHITCLCLLKEALGERQSRVFDIALATEASNALAGVFAPSKASRNQFQMSPETYDTSATTPNDVNSSSKIVLARTIKIVSSVSAFIVGAIVYGVTSLERMGWESIAGLKDVIHCMKEVIIIPLLYPDFFDNLELTTPRGVLLHGYPGTGKTLVVWSLIGACARGDRRITYFSRNGADCLGKYVGDDERQQRLLFQVAEKCQPSIIFFDEIDGPAPCRTPQQDQTHSYVVSTLLALMDGLKSRGPVVVIGATNRLDAVDPTLRRPGRFDREIYFPLPSTEDRASTLSLHTQKWQKPISGSLLGWIAKKTSGFAGADLQALCTQAAMNALKRNFPLQKVLSVAEKRNSSGCKNTPLPSFTVEERDWVEAFFVFAITVFPERSW
ncbi:hypothetical protein KIW84_023652 [Lathyrus oleraceus]|uniref:AAA+ ATPase domain-containing protein n=1 Tax=Pisum sativum TaxID=3888 RepID=A0A9D4YHD1_PEA|nr:hypothetical protein KIW84_023652 [Pisum sativum]